MFLDSLNDITKLHMAKKYTYAEIRAHISNTKDTSFIWISGIFLKN